MHQVDHLTEYSVPAHTINSTPNNYVISLANLSSHFAAAESAPSNIISIYDKSTLQRLQTLPGHEISTTSLHSMSETLVSSGKDGTVRVWDGRSKKPSLTRQSPSLCLNVLHYEKDNSEGFHSHTGHPLLRCVLRWHICCRWN